MEILNVERQDVSHPVNVHRGDKSCVMALLAGNTVAGNELSPFPIDGIRVVVEATRRAFDASENSACLSRGKSQAVVFDWPGADYPKLDQVLSGDAQNVPAANDLCDGSFRLSMLGMASVNPAEENVGVG